MMSSLESQLTGGASHLPDMPGRFLDSTPNESQRKTSTKTEENHGHSASAHSATPRAVDQLLGSRTKIQVSNLQIAGDQVIQFVTFSSPIVGGHLTIEKGHVFTIPKRSQRIARSVWFFRCLVIITSLAPKCRPHTMGFFNECHATTGHRPPLVSRSSLPSSKKIPWFQHPVSCQGKLSNKANSPWVFFPYIYI